MANTEENRLDQLEKQLETMKRANARSSTPVGAIAGIIGFIAFLILVANLPFPGSPTDGQRWGIGLGAGFAGFVLAALAVAFAKAALRALVEIFVVVVVFLNAVAALVVWLSSAGLSEWASSVNLAHGEDALPAVIAVIAVVVFLIDVVLMLFLYPMANVAGSDIFD